MSHLGFAEYIWLDGTKPTTLIRSKARVFSFGGPCPEISDFPEWSFDGSSTRQAEGHDSDCILKPVNFVNDPYRDNGYLVMCEVYTPDGKDPHPTNIRARLRQILDDGAAQHDPWVGFEQEYTIYKGNVPLGWPEFGFPAPQGPYYCGVGSEQMFGRDFVEEHREACMEAGLMYYGLNAEVMPGQWEYQVGYRGIDGEDAGVLNICDHAWIARWLLHRVSEFYGYHISFDNKPVKGDWNGAGMHTNFSTADTRHPQKGRASIDAAMKKLEKKHKEHISFYGHNLHERLTGTHETSSMEAFSVGEAHRGCSVRIPRPVQIKGCGYFEDRRPGANADPYLVASLLCATVCDVDDTSVLKKN